MGNIPLGREQLRHIARDLRAAGHGRFSTRIERVIDSHLIREKPVGRAPSRRATMTVKIGDAIRAHYDLYPDALQEDVARKFNVDGGRVSEALNGKWA